MITYKGYSIPDDKDSILALNIACQPSGSLVGALLWKDEKFKPFPIATSVSVDEMKSTTDVPGTVTRYVDSVKSIIDFDEM